ncbi:MAG: EamA family transporter [Spirochaetales bacterium]|nr:EamA family transporter [Spirochaetales bacterium]
MVNLSGKEKKINNIKIISSLGFTLLFFSLFEIISKKIELNSIVLTGIRFFLGGLFILFLFFKDIISEFTILKFNQKLQILLTGFLNVCIAMLSLQFAVKLGNATTSAIIISSNPVFVFIIQTFLEKTFNKKSDNKSKNLLFDFIQLILLLIGVFGIFIVIYKKDKGDNSISIFLAIIASISFALYTILSKKLLKKVSSVTLNSVSFSFNGLLLIILSFILYKNDIFIFISNINLEKIVLLSTLSFGVTGLAYITYFYALKNLDAVKVSLVFYLKPIVVLLLNSIILFENVGLNKIFGIFIILASLFVYINLDKIRKLLKNFSKN